jgi:hypothetical protein
MSRINDSDYLAAQLRRLAEEHVKITNPNLLKGQLEWMAIYAHEFQRIYAPLGRCFYPNYPNYEGH